MTRRQDISTADVARLWIGGETIMALAERFDTSIGTIKRRLQIARETMPDLPWDQRKPGTSVSVARQYATMNDGRAGTRSVRQGSVIRSRRSR